MNLDEAIARTKEASESQRLGELGRENASQFAAWLEELKQYKEENQPETNLDHYKDKVLEESMWNLAIVNGRPKRCNLTRCSDCEFNKKDQPKECRKRRIEWLKQPYKNPAIKLTKFENDLLQSYPRKYKFNSMHVLDTMKEKGYFKGIDDNEIIGDILENCEVIK